MDSSESLVQDTRLNAKVELNSTEHVFNRHGRQGGRREIWHRKKRLGHGSFGTVWLENCDRPYRRDTPQLRAVKEIHLEPVVGDGAAGVDYTRELLAFAKFSQPKFEPFFVRSFGWYATADSVFITMAYHPLGDLQQYLTAPLPEEQARSITEQLLEGLKHMHDNGFAHRDLKPKNVLVVSRGPDWGVQITDFGITKKIQDGQTAQATLNQGSMGFMAPEMIIPSLRGSHFAVDVWSLGSMAYFMLTNRLALADLGALHSFGKGAYEKVKTIFDGLDASLEATDFIIRCMARKPDDRPKVDNALSDPWMPISVAQDDPEAEDTESAVNSTPASSHPYIEDEMNEYYDTWTSKITSDETKSSDISPSKPDTARSHRRPSQETVKNRKPTSVSKSSSSKPLFKDGSPADRIPKTQPRPSYPLPRWNREEAGSKPAKTSESKTRTSVPLENGAAATRQIENGTSRRVRKKDDTPSSNPRLIEINPDPIVTPARHTDRDMSAGRIASKTPDYLRRGIRTLFFGSGSNESSTFQGALDKVRIEVRPWTQKLIICEMFPKQTVYNIKEEVQRQRGLPPAVQKLFLQQRQLPDFESVENFGPGSEHYLVLEVGFGEDVPNLVNKTVRFEGTLERIFIKRHDDTVFAIKVALNKPVLEIKKKIERHEGLPVEGQKLIYAGLVLVDEAPAEEYGIRLDRTVYLVRNSGYN